LDFSGVYTIGQAFADEILRVWQNQHPNIKFITTNTNEDINFMLSRV